MSDSFFYEGEVEADLGPEYSIWLQDLTEKKEWLGGAYDAAKTLDEIIVNKFGNNQKLRILIERSK